MTFTRPCGVIPSLVLVKPLTSQNSTVMTRRCPSAASMGRSISPSTMRGSMYFPKVSRMRSLRRNCSTISLKAVVKCPISSFDVMGTFPSRLPASTALAPSSSRRTGRVTPALTNSENTSPRTAASSVRNAAINVTRRCFWVVRSASARRSASMSARIPSSLLLSSSRSASTRVRLSSIAEAVACFQLIQQTADFIVEMSPGIVKGCIETGLEPHQRTRIAGGSIRFYQPADKLARRLNFVVEFTTLCVESGADCSDVIRWRLEFLDNDSPEVKRALHRTNIGSRKIAIGRNIAPGKCIQLVANLYDRRHRQNGSNGHQHNQCDRDPHDLPPNGQADHVLTSSRVRAATRLFHVQAMAPNWVVFCQQNQRRNIGPEGNTVSRCAVRGHNKGYRWDRTDSAPDVGPRSNSGRGFSYVGYFRSDARRCMGWEVTP